METDICKKFHDDPSRNPRTGRKIKIEGPTYLQLVRECSSLSRSVNLYNLVSVNDIDSIIYYIRERRNLNINKGEALEKAVLDDNIEIVRLLLENGADPNLPDNLLEISVHNNNTEITRLLLENNINFPVEEYGIDIPNDEQGVILTSVFENKNYDIMYLLLDYNFNIIDIFTLALQYNDVFAVKILLDDYKFDIKTVDNNDILDLIIIKDYDNTGDMLQLFLNYNLDIDYRHILITAITYNDYVNTQLLLEHGLDPNFVINDTSPIEVAITNSNMSIIKLLVEYGAEISDYIIDSVKDENFKQELKDLQKGDILVKFAGKLT